VVGHACGQTAYRFYHSPALYADVTTVPHIITYTFRFQILSIF